MSKKHGEGNSFLLKHVEPKVVGLSPTRLKHLGDNIQQRVDKSQLPGAVVLVARRGRIAYHKSFGFLDGATRQPMTNDAIFRIASMTKPITSLAAMMLVERGFLFLGAPLSEYLPEFSNLKVGVPRPDGSLEFVPALREPTILDLLRHTAGFSSGWFGTSPVKKLYEEAELYSETDTAADYCAKIAALPLETQPGSTWTYSEAVGVLGHVVEAVSDMRLDDFVAEKITGPLNMPDTGFYVSNLGSHRLAEPLGDNPSPSVDQKPIRCMGGGGMVSTAMDYARFCQFWLQNGELDGVRLVSRKTVELMTANHLPLGVMIDPDAANLFGPRLPTPEFGRGFGLGFSVRTSLGRAPWHGSVGAFEWVGATGCVFLIDPVEDLIAILMTYAPEQLVPNMYLTRALAYQAIDD